MLTVYHVTRLFVWLAMASAAIVSALFCSSAARADCIDATCRIVSQQAFGTGCVFAINRGTIYVVTAAHVVAQPDGLAGEFWRAGHQSAPVEAAILLRDEQADVAVVTVSADKLAGVLPAVVPLADANHVVRPGDTVRSVGCSKGAWATEWKGHVVACDGLGMHFVPPPANGRSGSAIFDAEGTKIVGILRARSADDSDGIATPIQTARRVLQRLGQVGASNAAAGWQSETPTGLKTVQCPVCPGCMGEDDAAAMTRRLRRNLPAPSSPWPTIPSPSVDPAQITGPIVGELDRIADRLQPTVNQPDPAAQQALGLAGQAAQKADAAADDVRRLRQEMPSLIGEQLKPIGQQVREIGTAVAPLLRVHEELERLKEKGGLIGKAAGHVEEKLENGDPVLRHVLIALAAIVPFGIFIFVAWRIHNLVSQHAGSTQTLTERAVEGLKSKLTAAAVANPALAPLAAGATAVDAVVKGIQEQLHSVQQQMTQVALATPTNAAATSTTATGTQAAGNP